MMVHVSLKTALLVMQVFRRGGRRKPESGGGQRVVQRAERMEGPDADGGIDAFFKQLQLCQKWFCYGIVATA
ncbi:unnamed protein product [Arctogadus glacialis]